MTVTELVILNLKHKQTNAELRKNGPYIKCLETVKRQKGCLGVTWGVTLEDPGKVVWFVGGLRADLDLSGVSIDFPDPSRVENNETAHRRLHEV